MPRPPETAPPLWAPRRGLGWSAPDAFAEGGRAPTAPHPHAAARRLPATDALQLPQLPSVGASPLSLEEIEPPLPPSWFTSAYSLDLGTVPKPSHPVECLVLDRAPPAAKALTARDLGYYGANGIRVSDVRRYHEHTSRQLEEESRALQRTLDANGIQVSHRAITRALCSPADSTQADPPAPPCRFPSHHHPNPPHPIQFNPSSAQHNPTQHNTAQHNTTQPTPHQTTICHTTPHYISLNRPISPYTTPHYTAPVHTSPA